MIQSRKAERDALANVKSGDDKEQVLKDAVSAVLEAFMDGRDFYVVGMEVGPGQSGLFGPYLTRKQAEIALQALNSPLQGQPAKAGIWKLYDVPES
jgi:hypothetical protein